MLYLVRHAKAGSRHDFVGDDRLRPLSANGRLQAHALATTLVAAGVTSLISSPYLRCIDECLAEGRSHLAVLELFESLPDATALCSHGDVIPETIAALERRGCAFTSPPDWRKATVWVLERGPEGEITTAAAWPPPDISC
jgi:hypothetical protein